MFSAGFWPRVSESASCLKVNLEKKHKYGFKNRKGGGGASSGLFPGSHFLIDQALTQISGSKIPKICPCDS